jgi:Fe-Mn family superoxide dismutase
MAMGQSRVYRARSFDLHGLQGISDRTVEMHLKLYEGYVKASNQLTAQIDEIVKQGTVDQEAMPAFSELVRRLGFEYNGMILHEAYFENLMHQGSSSPAQHSAFRSAVESCFGDLETWKEAFASVGQMRGVGWAICYLDPRNGRVTNHWISLHQNGNIAGFAPLLVMDMWEHAYLLDYPPSERGEYIAAFMSNVNWNIVEQRMNMPMPAWVGTGSA